MNDTSVDDPPFDELIPVPAPDEDDDVTARDDGGDKDDSEGDDDNGKKEEEEVTAGIDAMIGLLGGLITI